MKLSARCLYVGSEPVVNRKTGVPSLRIALAGLEDSETLNVTSKEVTAFDKIPRFSQVDCLFNYNQKYDYLSLVSVSPVSDQRPAPKT